jgi:hypothetical protein
MPSGTYAAVTAKGEPASVASVEKVELDNDDEKNFKSPPKKIVYGATIYFIFLSGYKLAQEIVDLANEIVTHNNLHTQVVGIIYKTKSGAVDTTPINENAKFINSIGITDKIVYIGNSSQYETYISWDPLGLDAFGYTSKALNNRSYSFVFIDAFTKGFNVTEPLTNGTFFKRIMDNKDDAYLLKKYDCLEKYDRDYHLSAFIARTAIHEMAHQVLDHQSGGHHSNVTEDSYKRYFTSEQIFYSKNRTFYDDNEVNGKMVALYRNNWIKDIHDFDNHRDENIMVAGSTVSQPRFPFEQNSRLFIRFLSIDYRLLDFHFSREGYLDDMIQGGKLEYVYIDKEKRPTDVYNKLFFIMTYKIDRLPQVFINDNVPDELYTKITTQTHYYHGYKK